MTVWLLMVHLEMTFTPGVFDTQDLCEDARARIIAYHNIDPELVICRPLRLNSDDGGNEAP
jgi:hypothetical protein